MSEKKDFIKISELTNWTNNPRDIDDDKFQELKNRIKRHGQFKPVIVNSGKHIPTKGEVLGGNMRFRAFRELGIEDIWVSWVHPKTEAEKIEIALTDNEELGFYKIDEITTLIQKYKADIDLTKYAIHLQQLQQLEQLEQLELYSGDYREVKIPKEAIIYCDPPYKGVETYREDGFNHDEFWDWAREQSKTNKIYISEYQAPDDFKIVLRFNQNSTYAGGNNKDQPDECLFTIKNKLKTG